MPRFSLTLPRYVDQTDSDPLRHTYAFAQRVEELGYYAAYVGHHSFTPETRDPSAPFAFLSAVAARTERLRLGTGIFIAALHHPAATCEQVSTLDQISGGRAVLGVAAGYRQYEFEGHGIPFGERGARLNETLAMLRRAWTTGSHAYHGDFFSMPDVPVYPPVVQQPHPPILVGGTSTAALDRAAALGDGWLSLPMERLPVVAELTERYRRACAEAGTTPYVCLMREAWAAPNAAAVEAQWFDRAVRFHRYYWETGTKGDESDPVLQRIGAGEPVDYAAFARDRAIAGTPDECVAELRRWHEAVGFDEVCLMFLGSSQPEAEVAAAVELFATEVVPGFEGSVA